MSCQAGLVELLHPLSVLKYREIEDLVLLNL